MMSESSEVTTNQITIQPREDPELDAKKGAGTQQRAHEQSRANVQAYLEARRSGALTNTSATPEATTSAPVNVEAANNESINNMVTYYRDRLKELYPGLINQVVPNLDSLHTMEEVKAAKEKLVAAKRAS